MIWVSGRKASVVGLSAPETRNKCPGLRRSGDSPRQRRAVLAPRRDRNAAPSSGAASQGSAASTGSLPMRRTGGRPWARRVIGDGTDRGLRRAGARHLGALAGEHLFQQGDARLWALQRTRRDGAARMTLQPVRDRGLACAIGARRRQVPREYATAPWRGPDRACSSPRAPRLLAVERVEGLALRRRQIAGSRPGAGEGQRAEAASAPARRASSGATARPSAW